MIDPKDWLEFGQKFHGHKCPAMPMGLRVGAAAMNALGVEGAKDGQLVQNFRGIYFGKDPVLARMLTQYLQLQVIDYLFIHLVELGLFTTIHHVRQ